MSEQLCPSAEALRACAQGLGDESTADDILRHAESCAPCSRALDRWLAVGLGIGPAPDGDPLADSDCRRLVHRLAALAADSAADPSAESAPELLADNTTVDLHATASSDPGDGSTAGRPGATDRYILGPELARGGMGAVFRATDTWFDREVAVKVLQERFGLGSGVAVRFADEARITGQLQHPAIPPVHDLGTFPDGRPFLVMKLIRGETLDRLLKDRPDPSADHGRFVAVFEQVCQAVAYAHAHNVLHRDLKPANVMVGNFGEVQVMDWGLAKVLKPEGAPADSGPDSAADPAVRVPHAADTVAGSVLGTPAFMPPEQATGAVAAIDTRSDVFGLGAILAVVLTGKPPFVASSAETTHVHAAQGRIGECFARLDASGADPDLVALCKRCLNPEQANRPTDAGVVARAVADLRQAAEERVRRAELDRVAAEGEAAAAELRATEQRKRRRVQLALMAALGLLAAGGGAVAWWADRQSRDREADELRQALVTEQRAAEETARLGRNTAAIAGLLTQIADALRAGDVPKATPLLDEAAKRAAEGGADAYLPRIAGYRAEAKLLHELDASERHRWNSALFQIRSFARQEELWRAAWAAFGADPATTAPADLARRISAAAARDRLISSFDGMLWQSHLPWDRDVLRNADPDPYRDAFRDAMFAKDPERLNLLSKDPRAFDQPVGFLVALGVAPDFVRRDERDREVRVAAAPLARKRALLLHALARHPNNPQLLLALAQLSLEATPGGGDERMVWCQAAVAAAPTNSVAWNNLGVALLDRREYPRAEVAFRHATRLEPTDGAPWTNLGTALFRLGDPVGAEAAYREALRLDPRDVVTLSNRSGLLQAKGELTAAVAECRKAIGLDPTCYLAHANLGFILFDLQDLNGAEAAHRKAIQLNPGFAPAYSGLGNVLLERGNLAAAEAAYRDSIRLNPLEPGTHFNLGVVLREKRDLVGAEAAHRAALRLDPLHAAAHNGLGNTLRDGGNLPAAIASYREAIRVRPTFAFAHNNLGIALAMKGDYDDAIASFNNALRHNPKNPGTRANLDKTLRMKADRDAKAKPLETAPAPRPVFDR